MPALESLRMLAASSAALNCIPSKGKDAATVISSLANTEGRELKDLASHLIAFPIFATKVQGAKRKADELDAAIQSKKRSWLQQMEEYLLERFSTLKSRQGGESSSAVDTAQELRRIRMTVAVMMAVDEAGLDDIDAMYHEWAKKSVSPRESVSSTPRSC
jgi:gas vesicle protein